MDLDFLEVLAPMLFRGLRVTVLVAVVGIFFGFIIGCFAGYGLQSDNRIAKGIGGIYIWIIRGTPLIVQALYVYYVVPPLFHVDLSALYAGIIVIALNSGAFIAEIVRGALQAVDLGQKEAGMCLGLSKRQTLFHVVIPPAFRAMLPALFNQFIISVKDTALLSVITVNEITMEIMKYTSTTFKFIPGYTAGALFYLGFLSLLMVAQKAIERQMKKE